MTTPPKTNDGKAATPGQPDAFRPTVATAAAQTEPAAGIPARPFSGQPGIAAAARPVRPFEGQGRPTLAAQPVAAKALAARPQAGALAPRPIPVQPMAQPAAAPAPAVRPTPGQALPARAQPMAPPGGTPQIPVRPPVALARAKGRHWLVLVSFLLIVVLPSLFWAWYLWDRASDQYLSTVGFSVRQEQQTPSLDILGGLAPFTGGGGAADTDILYQYIRSQDMVEKIDAELGIRDRFSRDWPRDFVFAFNPVGHIEDLTRYWQRQVKVLYDSQTQIITLNVSAFTPQDSQAIAAAVFQESSNKINELSAIALDDATRMAKLELDKARQELTVTRQGMTEFRMRSQIVDPAADLSSQMGVIAGLQAQLAEQLVSHDLLLDSAPQTDHRVTQSQQKIDALRRLIDAERDKFGADGKGPSGESYSQLMAEYEKLSVDREFAEGAYRSARIAYEAALAQAQRQSRYLAAHIQPKVAQSSVEPDRPWLLFMVFGLLLTGWSILILIYYSIRDRA